MSESTGDGGGKRRASRLIPPPGSVAVRMYRHGLGDCFLVAFAVERAGEAFYLLIDCGVILGTQRPESLMTKVAQDIAAATGGDIHLLVVTHQHWDHVSGFLQAAAVFEELRIQHLWLAWTEDPTDALAETLRRVFRRDLAALRRVARLGGAVTPPFDALLGLFGEPPSASGGGNDTEAAVATVREFAMSPPDYRRPGEGPLPLPDVSGLDGVPNARVYVLGPPRDARQLRRINPTARGGETYADVPSDTPTPRAAFLLAVRDEDDLSPAERDLRERCAPFDPRLRIKPADAATLPFFREHYGFDAAPGTAPSDQAQAPSWRRINEAWLGTAGEIALQLDNYTNNTSLVLAIELLPSRKVLLFVGDAQVGNWLSWDDLSWPSDHGSADTPPTRVRDLLARTVLYKVGHHGSHNATIRAFRGEPRGLELMCSPELVAMVPVHREMALQKRWRMMPFDALLTQLADKTRRRVMRSDDPLPRTQPDGMPDEEWAAFKANYAETALYLQYTVGDSSASVGGAYDTSPAPG